VVSSPQRGRWQRARQLKKALNAGVARKFRSLKNQRRPLRQDVLPAPARRSVQTIAAAATSIETEIVMLECHRSRGSNGCVCK
jgi:hypothetical protein